MDPESIVIYFHRKGWTARYMHNDLVATLVEETIAALIHTFPAVRDDFSYERTAPMKWNLKTRVHAVRAVIGDIVLFDRRDTVAG
jgi:hypothetical protein